MLQVTECEYDQAEFRKSPEWSLDSLPQVEQERLRMLECAPGAHDLSECPVHGAHWRRIYPELIAKLTPSNYIPLIWIDGPFVDVWLIHAIELVCGQTDGTIYYIPEITDTSGKVGYHHSWFAFYGTEKKLRQLLSVEEFDAESNVIYCAIVPEKDALPLLQTEIFSHDLRWFLQNSLALVAPATHFEGCYVLTSVPYLEHCLSAFDKVLKEFDGLQEDD